MNMHSHQIYSIKLYEVILFYQQQLRLGSMLFDVVMKTNLFIRFKIKVSQNC